MASIKKLGPGRYKVRWRTPGREERSRTFERKIDAERFLTSVTHSMLSGAYVDPAAGRVTFREYAERWREAQHQRESTKRNLKSKLTRHVYPVIGDAPLGKITALDLRALRSGLKLSDSTAAIVIGFVAAILRSAVEDKLIPASPMPRGLQAGSSSPPVVPPTLEHVNAITESINRRYRALVVLGSTSGLRIGELCGLDVPHFDALRRSVRVEQQLTYQAAGDGHVISPVKTTAGRRTVPIPAWAVEEVAAHLARYGPVECDGRELIFSNEAGRPVQPTVFTRGPWGTARKRAGLPEDFDPHGLRHFYASALIAHGESVTTVQHRLGHASAAVTLRVYAHLWQDADDRTRDAIDKAFGIDHSAAGERRASGRDPS